MAADTRLRAVGSSRSAVAVAIAKDRPEAALLKAAVVAAAARPDNFAAVATHR